MNLSVKLSLLTSLSFIGTLCWLVVNVMPAGGAKAALAARQTPVARAARASTSRGFTPVAQRQIAAAHQLRTPSVTQQPDGSVGTKRVFRFDDSGTAGDGAVRLASSVAEAQPYQPLVARTQPLRRFDAAGRSLEERLTPRDRRGRQIASGRVDEASRTTRKYVVRRGDSLIGIVREAYGSDSSTVLESVLEANPDLRGNPDLIKVGQALVLPGSAGQGEQVARASDGAQHSAAAARRRTASQSPAGFRYYTIQQHDSLRQIARRELGDEARWREIVTLNGMSDPNVIHPGKRIKLPLVELARR